MKKRMKLLLGLSFLSALCFATACKKLTDVEVYEQKGYTISVRYDPNGGEFLRPNVTLMDMFNPSNYEQDENGMIQIPLVDPEDDSRDNNVVQMTLAKSGYFLVGWYKTRDVKTNESGVAVDEAGEELTLKDGGYVYASTGKSATPAYTYDDLWDFEEDTLEYNAKAGEKLEMTLYAAWAPNYEFNYYYKVEGDSNAQWTKMTDTTTFNYRTVVESNAANGKNTIWTPDWKDGAMNHAYKYASGETYTFPKLTGSTFVAAYTDALCTQPIEETLVHHGSLDLEHGLAVNNVQNVYIVYKKGDWYKISAASQLNANANLNGYYEIMNNLDFADATWPTTFESGAFKGKFYSTTGSCFTLSNITATHGDNTKLYGGLFGQIAKDAEIKNVTFENATLNVSPANAFLQNSMFGLFSGNIDAEATVSGVTVGGTLRIGTFVKRSERECTINLIANGNLAGITATTVKLQVYGSKLIDTYKYTVNPDAVTVDEDYMVKLTFYTNMEETRPQVDIGTYTINGGLV